MNWKQVFAAAAVASALAGGASPASAQMAEGVAAVVNDHVISTFDVRQRANLLITSAGLQSTPEMQQRARAQALRDLIDERLQILETATYEIAVTPQEIDSRLNDIARSNNTDLAGFTQQLAQAGISPTTLRTQIEADIAWNRLIAGLYGTRVRVSDVEVRETQERIAANATRPQYQISEIFLPAESDAEFNEMEQGALRLLQEMQRGAPFPAVARQFSRAPSAVAGGDVGWIASTDLAPELQPIADRLETGQVSLPVRTPTGVYIIAMRDRRAGADPGASSTISLRQVSAPTARQSAVERLQRRGGCSDLDSQVAGIEGGVVVDLGEARETDLSPAIRARVNGVAAGSASPVVVDGETANTIFVCGRQTGGGAVPAREEIESRLREQELALLSERYLRNLRREATIITRQ
ncbi:peptidylprolyl isomerase [Terricaulis silvestris]|uniref:Parvulin-like PPIase n=1 Tax=Terricaulis silvestris TaxID=2686094 RepID=A0A6I6MN23_9CAUL|nr:peptidylprolyl isomerase [Terricaulis silvestris]QGZ95461.1 Peptidyl-prolyl cis-trans isomerase SurA [Terricaulis silvestris]